MPDFYTEYFAQIEAVQFQEANRLTIVLLLISRLCEDGPANEDLNLLRAEIEQLVEIYKSRLRIRKAFEEAHQLLKGHNERS
jgi:transcriptional regulator of heat shock response